MFRVAAKAQVAEVSDLCPTVSDPSLCGLVDVSEPLPLQRTSSIIPFSVNHRPSPAQLLLASRHATAAVSEMGLMAQGIYSHESSRKEYSFVRGKAVLCCAVRWTLYAGVSCGWDGRWGCLAFALPF